MTNQSAAAFPTGRTEKEDLGFEGVRYKKAQIGLTKREYFAAHAPITLTDALGYHEKTVPPISYARVLKTLRQMRYAYADEMLKDEEKEHENTTQTGQ